MTLPVIHVGFHKCGSTTLQGALFALHPDVVNLGEPVEDPSALAAVSNIWESCRLDPAERKPFDLEGSRLLWLKAFASVPPGKTAVFSKEKLTRFGYCDATLPAKLRSLVGPARIVIMTRHQVKLVESLYHAHTWGEVSPEQWLEAETEGPLNRDRFHIYRYHTFAQAYVEAFGRENVRVFLLEALASNMESFARSFSDFIGIDADEAIKLLRGKRLHKRQTWRGLAYAQLRKHLGANIRFGRYVSPKVIDAFSLFLSRGRSVRVELPARWVGDLESYYRDENRRLAECWGLPLEKYGYPL